MNSSWKQSNIWTMLKKKNSPDTDHTKHSSHLISSYMLWGSQEHQAPRQQRSGIRARAPSVWDSCTHIRTHPRPRQKYTCMHRWLKNLGAGQGGGRKGWPRICHQLQSGGPENPSAAGWTHVRIKTKAEHRIKAGCSEKRVERWWCRGF